MACGGPSKDYAYLQGEKAFEQVLELLETEFQVRNPHKFAEHLEAKDYVEGDIRRAQLNWTRREVAEWDENTKELKELLCKMIWANDAYGF